MFLDKYSIYPLPSASVLNTAKLSVTSVKFLPSVCLRQKSPSNCQKVKVADMQL